MHICIHAVNGKEAERKVSTESSLWVNASGVKQVFVICMLADHSCCIRSDMSSNMIPIVI